jgi:hypothetical protein
MASDRVTAAKTALCEGGQRAGPTTVGAVDEAGADVHYVTLTLGDHMPDHPLGHVEKAAQVDRSDRFVVVDAVLSERLANENPSIVDQRIDTPVTLESLLYHAPGRLRLGDVTLHGHEIR